MSLIIQYNHIKSEPRENGGEKHVIACSSGVKDKMMIFKDHHPRGSVGIRIENEHSETSPVVFVNQDALPELINLLQSMGKETG